MSLILNIALSLSIFPAFTIKPLSISINLFLSLCLSYPPLSNSLNSSQPCSLSFSLALYPSCSLLFIPLLCIFLFLSPLCIFLFLSLRYYLDQLLSLQTRLKFLEYIAAHQTHEIRKAINELRGIPNSYVLLGIGIHDDFYFKNVATKVRRGIKLFHNNASVTVLGI